MLNTIITVTLLYISVLSNGIEVADRDGREIGLIVVADTDNNIDWILQILLHATSSLPDANDPDGQEEDDPDGLSEPTLGSFQVVDTANSRVICEL